MGSVVKALAKVLNPIAGPIAGAGLVPVWGVVRHTGRRSGRSFVTPIALVAAVDGFYIPLPFSDKTDWCRNLLAAHGGVIRWRGAEYPVREPEVVGWSVAAPAFNIVLRTLLRTFGIRRFLHVHRMA